MNIREKVYQMFILGIDGDGYIDALKNGLGGMIFFTHDIQSEKQFTSLIYKIKSSSKIPPFLSIDQEGGRVERTENLHNGKKYLSAKYAYEKGRDFLKAQTEEIAKELKSFGINLNFAPCIDVNTNPKNPIIGERAFSDKADEVITAEKIVSEIYRTNGIIPCAKHFPGHGDAETDSHLALPVINKSLDDMQEHIKPFRYAVKNGIDIVMVAHLHCTCFEKEPIPASLSKNAVQFLRNDLGFNGIAVSDDMIMKGVSAYHKTNAVEMGIKAGLNMFIYRNSSPETINIIEKVADKAETDKELRENIEKSFALITKMKSDFNIS